MRANSMIYENSRKRHDMSFFLPHLKEILNYRPDGNEFKNSDLYRLISSLP